MFWGRNGFWRVDDLGKGEGKGIVPVTSTSKTVRREESTSLRSDNRFIFTSEMSFLAVATTGILVVRRSCLVNSKPIPRLAGQTNDHAIAHDLLV